ncbi:MAG TPA: transposase, partial [Acholeplasmataceae bacterium]|nr:transposase [Acholeplasmataceae bacterium]
RTKTGVQRYFCPSCKKTFITDQTPIKNFKQSEALIKRFMGYMIDDVTLDVAARNLSIDHKTALYYRYMIFHALFEYQGEVILDGSIMIDETFISIREKKYKIQRPDGQDIRGLSFNQLCVITVMNLRGLCTAKVSSRAMAQPEDFIRLFNHNLGKVKRFLHDGNSKQVQFMKLYDVERINARKSADADLSTLIVDSLHSSLKRYLFKHAGFRLKHLQHYLNFFVYRHNQLVLSDARNKKDQLKAKNEMIDDLYKRMKKTCKNIKYQTFLKDKGITDILEKHR